MPLNLELLPDKPKQKTGFNPNLLPDKPKGIGLDFSLLPDKVTPSRFDGRTLLDIATMGLSYPLTHPREAQKILTGLEIGLKVAPPTFAPFLAEAVISGAGEAIQKREPWTKVFKGIPENVKSYVGDILNKARYVSGVTPVIDKAKVTTFADVWGNYYKSITGKEAPEWYKTSAGLLQFVGLSSSSPEFMKIMKTAIGKPAKVVAGGIRTTAEVVAEAPIQAKRAFLNVMENRVLARSFIKEYGRDTYKAFTDWTKELEAGMGQTVKPEYVARYLFGVERPAIIRPAETAIPEIPREVIPKSVVPAPVVPATTITKAPTMPTIPQLSIPAPVVSGGKEEVKEIPAKKSFKILPHKEQLLTQIQEAIKTAPETAEERTTEPEKVSFQIDGGAEIWNNKQALTEFYNRIKKTAAIMVFAKEGVSIPRATAAKQEGWDKLIKTPKGYVTDGKILIKGETPKSVKIDETREIKNIESFTNILNSETQPVIFQYYGVEGYEGAALSPQPIPQLEKDYLPQAVFQNSATNRYFTYNQFKFNILRNRFPDATYGVTKEGQLTAYVKGEPVGVLLPMQIDLAEPPFKELKIGAEEEIAEGVEEEKSRRPSGPAFAMPEGGLEEWIKRQEQEQNLKLKGLEMPELVKLSYDLMGKYPVVKKLIRNLGLFKFGKGIALDVKIFKNPQLASMILAHEIGHLVDWLPDYTISRGNILGRIATLKRYMRSLLAEKPGMEGTVLTPEDRDRLRRTAKAELESERKLGEREIIEEVIKEIPIYEKSGITTDEILSIWREAATTIKETNPELYDFIAKLSPEQKKSVVKQALRGIVDERILEMGGGKRVGTKIVKEQVRRIITPEEVTPLAIRKRFKELLKQEIIKRKLFEREVIEDELKKVTQWWNPFDDSVGGWYRSYRYKSTELYAEAISVMLNIPEKLEELAPQFYKAFWNYIERKPEVKDSLMELQDFLNMGEEEKVRRRQEDIRSSFQTGEEKFYEARNKYRLAQKSLWFRLRTELIDKNTALIDKLKEFERQGGKINPEDNPKFYLEEYNYIGGKIKNLLEKINGNSINPLIENGMSVEDLGEYLFLNRVITERADIANPLGQNRDTAARQLEYLRNTLGVEKSNILQISVLNFQQEVKHMVAEAEKEGLIKSEVYAQIVTNPAYATFQVLDYLDDYVSPSIIKQVGTLKPIANPFVSTVIKTISTLRAIERNRTNKSVISFLQASFPKEIEVAPTRRFGKYKVEIPEKEGVEIIRVREEGILRGFYVDPYIARSVNYQSSTSANGVLSVLRFLNRGWFRPIYVNLNLGFQTYNLMRDFKRAWKLNPHISFVRMLGKYWDALPIAKSRIWGDFSHPVIKEMQQSGMLSITYNDIMRGADETDETQIDYLLNRYNVLKNTSKERKGIVGILINPVIKYIDFVEKLGNLVETLPKVAGYLSRQKSGLSIKEIAHEVRVYSGSPDFLRKGAGYDWYNNLFLFSNAIKEGLRGDAEGAFKNPRTRAGYWWKTAQIDLLPKLLMFLATLGFFGQRLKEHFEKQSEYDKTNYITLPLGETTDGKAIYFRIPQDEAGRIIGALFWKAIYFDKDNIAESLQQIGSPLGQQLPSVTPVVDLITNWFLYATGRTPYDWYRGKDILSEEEMLAGGWYSFKPIAEWTSQELGLGVNLKREDDTVFETVIRNTPIVQRYLKITDVGGWERERKERKEYRKFRATRTLEKRYMK